MNPISIPPIVMATLVFYVGFYHFLIYHRQKENRENLTFALTCFCVGLYAFCCSGLYNASSPEVGVEWQRLQGSSLAILGISLLWFLNDYTGYMNKKIVIGFTVYYIFAALTGLLIRSDLTWSNVYSVKEVWLPFEYSITYNEMAPGTLINFQSVVGLIYFIYIITVGIKFYRSGNKKRGTPLLIAIALLCAGLINDTCISGGFYDFIYILEYSYIGMILVFTFFLITKIIKAVEVKIALRKSEEIYRLIAENVSDVIWTMDLNLKFTYVSPSVYQHRGYTVKETMEQPLNEIMAPQSLEKLLNVYAEKLKFIESGNPLGWEPYILEAEQYCKDGTVIWTSNNVSILIGPDKQPMSILGVSRDITDSILAESAVKESEKKYRQIYDNIVDVYYEATLDGTILEVSPSIEKLSQYKREELIGKSLYDLYTNPSERDDLIEVLLNKGSAIDYEIGLSDKNGQQHICSLNVEIIKDNQDNPKKIVGICRDISDRKNAEDGKIKVQRIADEHEKMALVGQVAGKMAHDFNNVLSIIMGNTELSLLDCKDIQTKKTLELIYKQTIRGKNLTKNLVAFADDQEPKQEFFKINEKIDLVISLLKKDLEGIEIIKEDKPETPSLLADPGMIEHALINLIQNSIHATSMEKNPKIIMRTYSLKDNIYFEIEDNGCGIPENHFENIYEPSFTLKGEKDISNSYENSIKGTGYGMSNIKKYIEQHKGKISFESKFGSGTKFIISLPVVKKQLTNDEKAEIRETTTHFKKYILLVEDEIAISDIQYQILTQEPCNHKVDVANNGQAAMDLFDRNDYDFISLDYVLSGKISGMEVYSYVRKNNKTIPILFISGNIEFLESTENLKHKDPFIEHLSKPCQNKDYVHGINKLFEKLLVE
jgi:PAS domain S-box-containing protein